MRTRSILMQHINNDTRQLCKPTGAKQHVGLIANELCSGSLPTEQNVRACPSELPVNYRGAFLNRLGTRTFLPPSR
jgi:hypothetical protein